MNTRKRFKGSIFHVLFATAQMEVLTLPLHQFLPIQEIKCVQRTFHVWKVPNAAIQIGTPYPSSSRPRTLSSNTPSLSSLYPSWCVWFLFLHLCSFWHLIYPDIQLMEGKDRRGHSHSTHASLSPWRHECTTWRKQSPVWTWAKGQFYSLVYFPGLAQ